MIVVSNSSPLITLAKIEKLYILKELFGEIIVPKAVWYEVVVKGKGKPGAEEIEKAEWIKVREVKDKVSIEVLKGEIEVGETEAIVIAKEVRADLLIMDERIPRIIAESIGLNVIGTLAIIYIARKKGLIKEDFDEIVKELKSKGVRFSDKVIYRLKQKWGDIV
ncbi:DUF3368 domain-containing protein [Archaeoglobales archaeon]|nr:MAG: DUF3368 domain-containing protein [Archaeoglobales archaeon]